MSLLVIVTAGCIRDDSSEGSIPLAGIKLTHYNSDALPTFYTGEVSTWEPEIDWNGEKESDYEFSWILNGKTEICTEKVLNYTFSKPGTQYLALVVTNKHNGLHYSQNYNVTATSPFGLGWVILSKGDDNSSRFSYVRYSDFAAYPDVYAKMYPDDPLGSGPIGIATHAIASADEVLIKQKDGGWVELDGKSFGKVSSIEKEFISENATVALPEEEGGFELASVEYTHRGTEFVLSKNGKLYFREPGSPTSASATLNTSYFFNVPYYYKNYTEPSKFTYHAMFCHQYYCPVFDDANKRWIPFGVTTGNPRNIIAMKWKSGVKPSADYDYIAGMASDVNLLFANVMSYKTNKAENLFAVLEKNGKVTCNLSTWSGGSPSGSITVEVLTYVQKDFPEGYTITKDTPMWLMAMCQGSSQFTTDPYLLFAQGSKLYVYNFSLASDQVTLIRDFSVGKSACKGNVTSIVQSGDCNQIGVTTSDGHVYILKGGQTNLYSFFQKTVDPNDPDNNGQELAHVSGLPGTPVQIAFKYGKVANWQNSKVDE